MEKSLKGIMKRTKPAVFLIKQKPLRLAAFVSGQGSTLQSLMDAQSSNIKLVLSDKNCLALSKAKRFGVEVLNLEDQFEKINNLKNNVDLDFKNKKTEIEKLWTEIHHQLVRRKIDGLILCGFMRILPKSFLNLWLRPVVNIHPSLLPLFPGRDGIGQAVHNNGPFGVSLHFVSEVVDAGGLILQKLIFSKAASSVDSQAQRLLYARSEQILLREFLLRWG